MGPVLPMRELAWLMAELRTHHRGHGRTLSAAMVEALAAHRLDGGMALRIRYERRAEGNVIAVPARTIPLAS